MKPNEPRPLNEILKRIMLRAAALRLSAGIMALLAAAGWIFLIVVVWVAAGAAPLWQTLTVSWVVVGLLCAGAVFMIVLPVARTPGPKRLADEIEHRKDFKDLLIAAYEFSQNEDASKRYNPALIREVIRRAVEELSPLQARFLFLRGTQMAFAPIAYGGLLLILLLTLVRPALVFEAGKRIAHPRSSAAPSRAANILTSPCGITVLAGSDVEVSGIDFGGTERPVRIHFSGADGFWKSEPARRDSVRIEDAVLPRYFHEFRGLRNSLSYFFESDDAQTAVCDITVVHKPIVRDLMIVRTPPAYTRERPDTLVDSGGNVHALEGTRIAITGTSNNILAAAAVRFDETRDGGTRPPQEIGHAGREFGFGFTALRDEFYRILLEDTAGYRNDDPLVYAVETYKDNPPTLDVLEPGGDSSLPRTQQVNVSFVAGDDYGVASAAIFYRKGSDGPFVKKDIDCAEQTGRKEIAQSFVWDLRDVSLFPGNTVEYYLQVSDNNVATGPGIAKSSVFRITVPTMEELYSGVAEEESQRSDLLSESLTAGEELRERIERLSREFKKTQNLDWSQKKEADKAVAAQKEIQSKLEEVKSSLDATLQELSDNRMTSQAIGEKMEEIRKLLDEINDDALNKYIEDMQRAISAMNPQEIQSALQNVSMSADDFLKRLERTASLLEAVRQEQRMEELVRKSRDLAEKQKDLLDETAATARENKDAMTDLAKRQEELAKEAAGMKERVDEFKQSVDEKEIASRIEASSQCLSQNGVAGKMGKASQSLRQGEKDEAMEQQKRALDDLIGLFASLSSCQACMGQMAMQKQAVYLQKYAKEMLGVSFKQEELLNQLGAAAGSAQDTPASRALAEKQLICQKAAQTIADEVYEISKQTMAISPALLHYLGETLKAMNSVLFDLDQNRTFYAMPQASAALEGLNRATIEMLRVSKSCSSGAGAGMGMRDLMQQLLSGQQEVLQQSQEALAMQLLQEQMRMEQQAKMQRLAAAERSLKEIADEIAKQSKEEGGTLGRMDKIREDMDAVIKDLENNALGNRTVDRQERILSRLLDAQRSVHTRDYERKRKSVTAGDMYSQALAGKQTEGSARELREAIRRAMQLKAPGEFEDLIKSYFRALAEEHAAPPAEDQR